MTRARELAKLANSSVFSVDSSNNVGINSSTPDAKLDVVGVVSATQYFGDGSNLTGIVAGATLNASSGTQRLVVTSQTSGSMTQAATNADIAYNTSTNTLSATNFSGTLLGNATGLQGTPSITVQDVAAEKVSIAGTISYEDVTNVNSVGIITANKGIKVPNYGMTVTGVVTATSYQGDGSSLTGVESGVSNFVASGTISNGATVIVKADGTATVVTQAGSANPTIGSEVVFESASTTYVSTQYIGSSKVVMVYKDVTGNNYGTAVVGTISGTSISFGTPELFTLASSYHTSAYDSTNSRIVAVYRDDSNDNGTVRVASISGTTFTWGSEVEFTTNNTSEISATFVGSGKVVIAYRDNSAGDVGKAVVGTVNPANNSISFGSITTFESGATKYTSGTYDSVNNKVVIAYQDDGDSDYGKAVVGTVSGTSISFGSPVPFNSTGETQYIGSTFDSTNNKVIVTYKDGGNNGYGTAKVGTVSGTSISFGSAVVFNSGNSAYNSPVYDSAKQKVVVAYNDVGNSQYGTLVVGTVSGTSISFGSEYVFNSGQTDKIGVAYDSTNEKVAIAYKDSGNSSYGTAVVVNATSVTTNLTAENYIGIAAEAIANGATGKITTIGGINSGQTGLTAAQTYYVQTDGSLGTSAGNPSVVAGTAVSNTKVLVWKS